jgi:MFS family permease
MTRMSMISNLEPSQVAQSGLFGWYHQGTPAARKGLWAAALGWMLDGFDVMLYALVLGALLQEFSISTRTAGMLGSLTLAASGLGGVLFGAIADRMGRRRAMIGSILIYSIFTGLCGLAQTVTQLAVFRFVLGFGMGGEWTSGAALVSETWPDKHRGKAVAWMQSAWAIGYAAAAIVVGLVLPRFGWRVVFLIGLLPALLTLWIRRHVEESELWLASQREPARARPSVRDVFFGRFASTTMLLTFLSLTTVFAYWGLSLWVPAYLSLPVTRGGLGLSTSMTTLLVVTMQVGTFLGYVSFGYVSDAFGRRKSFVTYILVAAVLILVYSAIKSIPLLLVVGPLVAFFGTGLFSGFGVITAEIYPTAVRAIAQGFTLNMGRLGSAAAPFVVGSLAETHGFGTAFAILAAALVLGSLTWIWLPETRGRSLAV